MPSVRVLSVVLLAGLGAASAGLAGTSPSPDTTSNRRPAIASSAQEPPAERSTSSRSRSAERRSATAFDAQTENAKPGSADWRISGRRGTAPGLQAYAGQVSVAAGERVPLHVLASGREPIAVRAFRIGWYDGTGAREVWQSTLTGSGAGGPAADPASWPIRGFAETAAWPPGQYLLRLDRGGASRFVPVLVRSPQMAGALVLVTSPLTEQAGNGSTPAGAQERSFDRPYTQGYGAGTLLSTGAPVIQLAERDGHEIAYTTDLDLAEQPRSVAGATALVFGSASQYWTAELRTSVIGAISAGTNAAFFGAGTATRRVELSSDGRSMKVVSPPPPATAALTGLRPVCPAAATGTAVSLSGAAAWVVRDPDWWGYSRVEVRAGEVLPGLVSAAPDGVAGSEPASGVQVLAQSPVGCAEGTSAGPHTAISWTSPGGAGVFASGTTRWACAAGNTCPSGPGSGTPVPRTTRKIAAAVTRAVLTEFAQPKAGLAQLG